MSGLHDQRMVRAAAVVLLAAAVAAGCGGGGGGGTKTTTGGTGSTTTTTATTTTSTGTSTGGGANVTDEAYADTEYADLTLAQKQACPSSGSTQWRVLYRGKEAIVECGRALAKVTAGGHTIVLRNGWCNLTPDEASYNFGGYVSDPSVDGIKQPEIAHAIPRFDLTLGGPNHHPVRGDGTYTDQPVSDITKARYGMNIVIADAGKLWTHDGFDHPATVTLTHDRTRGSFRSTSVIGGQPMSGTFACGSRITGGTAMDTG